MGLETAARLVNEPECPHCREALAPSHDSWGGWRLCPRCGRAGPPPERPPEFGFDARAALKASTAAAPADDFKVRPIPTPARSRAAWLLAALAAAVIAVVVYVHLLGQLQSDVALMGVAALLLCCLLFYVSGDRKR